MGRDNQIMIEIFGALAHFAYLCSVIIDNRIINQDIRRRLVDELMAKVKTLFYKHI